jgi:Bacterial membrane protein YfhO
MRTWNGVIVLVLFAVVFAALFSPVLLTGGILAARDSVHEYYPSFAARNHGWDPYMYGGYPAFADPEEMALYPPARLLGPVPGGWNAFVVLGFALAATFTFLYVVTITGSRRAGLLSGLAFAMGGFLVSTMGIIVILHAGLWLPAILWGVEKLRRDPTPGRIAFVALAVAMAFLAGHPQTTTYALLVVAFYVLASTRAAPCGAVRFVRAAAIAGVLGVLLSAAMLLPARELAGQSVRSEISFDTFMEFAGKPSQLLEVVLPGPLLLRKAVHAANRGTLWELGSRGGYVGALTLLLAAVAVLRRWREREILFFSALAAISLLLVVGGEAVGAVVYRIPALQLFRASVRHFYEFSFAVSVLGGIGLATLERDGRMPFRRTLAAAGVLLFLLVALGSFVLSPVPVDAASFAASPAVWIQAGHWLAACGLVLAWTGGKRAAWLAVGLVAVDVSSHALAAEWHQRPATAEDFAMPPSLEGIAAELARTHERLSPSQRHPSVATAPPNRNRLWGVSSALGYNPLGLRRVDEVLGWRRRRMTPFLAAPDHRGDDLLAVRFVLVPEENTLDVAEADGNPKWTFRESAAGVRVYENRNAQPRAWMTYDAIVLAPEEQLATITTSRLPDGRKWEPAAVALLEEGPAPAPAAGEVEGAAAHVERMEPGRLRIAVDTPAAGLLVLSDIWYPGWEATVDGVRTPLLRCDYILMAVPVPAGDAIVELRFRSRSRAVGMAISAAALLAILALVGWEVRRVRATRAARV